MRTHNNNDRTKGLYSRVPEQHMERQTCSFINKITPKLGRSYLRTAHSHPLHIPILSKLEN